MADECSQSAPMTTPSGCGWGPIASSRRPRGAPRQPRERGLEAGWLACSLRLLRLHRSAVGLERGRFLAALEGHFSSVTRVAWSPDGQRSLSGSREKTELPWDAEQAQKLAALEGHSSGVTSVTWSAVGRRALSGSEECTIRLWDMEGAHTSVVLEGHCDRDLTVAWSPDGRGAVSGSSDRTVRIWDVVSTLTSRIDRPPGTSTPSLAFLQRGTPWQRLAWSRCSRSSSPTSGDDAWSTSSAT
jgi:WD40 repeat protein